MSISTSPSLLDRLHSPDDGAAWSKFVDLYTPLLFYWARKLGELEADSADLVQEVRMHLLRKMPNFDYDKTKGFRSWLRTVAHNHWRNLRRQRKGDGNREPVDLDAVAEDDDPF